MALQNDTMRRLRLNHGPAWRWHLANAVNRGEVDPDRVPWDEALRLAVGYVTVVMRSDRAQHAAKPSIQKMLQSRVLWTTRSNRDQLKIMIMGELPPTDITQRLGTSAELLDLTEQLFFDVRAVRNQSDWLMAHVIKEEEYAGDRRLADKLKISLHCGPVAARALLDVDSDALINEGLSVAEARIKLHFNFLEALRVSPNSAEGSLKIIEWRTALRCAEKDAESRQVALVKSCRLALEEAKLKELDLEIKLQQTKERAAKAQERAAAKLKHQKDLLRREQLLRRRPHVDWDALGPAKSR